MTAIPNKLPGRGKLVETINRLIDCVSERTIVTSPDIKPQKRTGGTALIAVSKGAGAATSENVWQ